MHQDVKQYVYCRPLLYGKDWDEEFTIIKKKAFENKETIGDEMIIKESLKSAHMDYASSQKYISQVFKDAVYSKKRNP